jgi:hypothetical protein
MFGLLLTRLCDYLIVCKRCGENVPAPVQTMPSSWIVAECPLCGERRRYLPPDIFRGRLSMRLAAQPFECGRLGPEEARARRSEL